MAQHVKAEGRRGGKEGGADYDFVYGGHNLMTKN